VSRPRVLVLNPNSNSSVTEGLERAVEGQGRSLGVDIDCASLAQAPFGIETDQDIETVVPLLIREVIEQGDAYNAIVIACYSDPGLVESRAAGATPVFGIHEAALTEAESFDRPFGVLALGEASIARHLAYVRRLGKDRLHVGERALNMSVDAAANDPRALERIVQTGRALIRASGAATLILGCAGMATHREAAEEALGIPVIDPVQAAVRQACATIPMA